MIKKASSLTLSLLSFTPARKLSIFRIQLGTNMSLDSNIKYCFKSQWIAKRGNKIFSISTFFGAKKFFVDPPYSTHDNYVSRLWGTCQKYKLHLRTKYVGDFAKMDIRWINSSLHFRPCAVVILATSVSTFTDLPRLWCLAGASQWQR